MKNNFTDKISIVLSLIISFLGGKLIYSSSLVQKLELILTDNLIKIRSQTIEPSDNILLVNLDRETFLRPEIENRQQFYSHIARWFLEQKAGVVILNLPQEWRSTSSITDITQNDENVSGGVEQLISKHSNQIVLVAPVLKVSDQYNNRLVNYSPYIPLNDNIQTTQENSPMLQNLITLIGFFEYENIEPENPANLYSPARTAYHHGNFSH